VVQIAPLPPPPPSERSPRRAPDRRREIVAAASRVFRRRGWHAAGMRDIAAELGMAVGNLYYYFRDKQELLAFVQEDALAGLLGLAARVRGLDLAPGAKLYLLIAGHVLRLNEGSPGSLAHLEVEALGERFRRTVQARRDAYELVFRELIEEGMAVGQFRPLDAKVAALAILGAINWTVKWFRPGGGKPAAEIGNESAELLVRGLLAPGVPFAAPPSPFPPETPQPEPE
jgi:AcrR family transcriptional regulator